ncbi:hypothetical protein K2173_001032 [Erythroxylum novogranatense]|uniref:C3H1-type domain-containing protein n=1 Tax=Erythroxylum novogranatense TaxID=1862640 RepID=A0AAV8SIB2_9ROSI|nr:hypothetical protein K2173_001032 [Erythroxylum novogranatense]
MERFRYPNSLTNPNGGAEFGFNSSPSSLDSSPYGLHHTVGEDEFPEQSHKHLDLHKGKGRFTHDQVVVEESSVRKELEQKLSFGGAKNEEEGKHLNNLSEDELENGGNDDKHENVVWSEIGCGVDGINSGSISHQYPLRPDAEDCPFYMKNGSCKFGYNCRFNHPIRRQIMPVKEKIPEGEEAIERPGQSECKYYLMTGGCKYGNACRFNHSTPKYPVLPDSELNFLGLPIRPREKECPYYMRKGSCKFGASCKFNHPDPTAAEGSELPSAFGNGSSASLQGPSQSSVSSWSSSSALNEAAPCVPMMYSPTQGVATQNSEWNGYQAPVYPPERSMHLSPAYVMNNSATDPNLYGHQQQLVVNEYPERPGAPECSFYMKTGDCKFKSNCKYHHPKNRISKSPPCALSNKGLPLRPDQNICSHYSRYGICKFGPACKFNHPEQLPSSAGSRVDRPTPFGNSASEEASMA